MTHYTLFAPESVHCKKTERKQRFADNIITFDIETTSCFYSSDHIAKPFDFHKSADYYKKLNKAALCYIWMLSIDGIVYYGRNLSEFPDFIRTVKSAINMDVLVWVHNLSFEFQHIRTLFEWDLVNARQVRKPYRARTVDGIEFRCTYALTNMSLDAVAKNYHTRPKMCGDLDYYKLRTPATELTEKEQGYCEGDVLVLHDFVSTFPLPLENTPLTQTGYVRRAAKAVMGKKVCRINARRNETEPMLFRLINSAYAGGYTHANCHYAGRIIDDVSSYDFSSSYPYVMLSERYPSSRFLPQFELSFDVLDRYPQPRHYVYIFDVTVFNYRCTTRNTFISASKCKFLIGGVFDNGRVLAADEMRIVLTDVDVEFFRKTGEWTDIIYHDGAAANAQYLPRSLWQFVLDLYNDKTTLKGVEGMEDLYLQKKQMLNSVYGMCCTNTVKPDVEYINGEWHDPQTLTNDEMIKKLLDNVREGFLDYAVGVWVTAYARRNLWQAIYTLDDVVVYCDTDSVKALTCDRLTEYVKEYNTQVDAKLRAAAEYYGYDGDFTPLDKNGTPHPLGYFESDGHYKKFITYGAKKYAYDNGDGVHITVAGVPKGYGKYIKKLSQFQLGAVFAPTKELSKSISHYCDEPTTLVFPDGIFETLTGVCLQPTSYTLNVTDSYRYLWEKSIGK